MYQPAEITIKSIIQHLLKTLLFLAIMFFIIVRKKCNSLNTNLLNCFEIKRGLSGQSPFIFVRFVSMTKY